MTRVLKRILFWGSQVAFGLFLLSSANNIFDWGIYPTVMCLMGPSLGGITMALASIPFNYLLIRLYDFLGQDLMGIESLKEFENSETDSWTKRKLRKLLTRSRIGTFIFLSIYDPIPATLYMRSGTNTFHGLRGRDWIWFSISTIIANITWMILMGAGVVAVEATVGACVI